MPEREVFLPSEMLVERCDTAEEFELKPRFFEFHEIDFRRRIFRTSGCAQAMSSRIFLTLATSERTQH